MLRGQGWYGPIVPLPDVYTPEEERCGEEIPTSSQRCSDKAWLLANTAAFGRAAAHIRWMNDDRKVTSKSPKQSSYHGTIADTVDTRDHGPPRPSPPGVAHGRIRQIQGDTVAAALRPPPHVELF